MTTAYIPITIFIDINYIFVLLLPKKEDRITIFAAFHVIKSNVTKKRLGDAMGGKVLELESEKLMRLGKEHGKLELLYDLVNDKTINFIHIFKRDWRRQSLSH